MDEADSVLVDEARVPLVMAGSTETDPGDPEVAKIVAGLRAGAHYEQDEDGRNAWLTAGRRAGSSSARSAASTSTPRSTATGWPR